MELLRVGKSALLYIGDSLAVLPTLPAESVHCCATSPPYLGLRDYGTGQWEGGDPGCDHKNDVAPTSARPLGKLHGGDDEFHSTPYRNDCGKCGARRTDNQIGLEETPAAYVDKLVRVFREVRRVLRDDAVLWLNLGDSYAGSGVGAKEFLPGNLAKNGGVSNRNGVGAVPGCKPKDLIGIPWLTAFALRDDGWYLRSAAPWVKRNAMPESVRDRPVNAVEYIFLLSKSERYFYDAAAVAMASRRYNFVGMHTKPQVGRKLESTQRGDNGRKTTGGFPMPADERARRNADWWFESLGMVPDEDGLPLGFDVVSEPYRAEHYACWPQKLVLPMIAAGCPPGGTVLDPFNGAATTGVVALNLHRKYIGIELNPVYVEMSRKRLLAKATTLWG